MPFFHLPLQYVLYSVILLVEAYNDPIGQSEINCVPIGLAVNNQVSVQTSNMCSALLLVQRLATRFQYRPPKCAVRSYWSSGQQPAWTSNMFCALLLVQQLATRFQYGQAICSLRSYWSSSKQPGYVLCAPIGLAVSWRL